VVTKLFGMVRPDVAFFGQKDAQQCVVIRRLVTDLDLDIEIAICPTVREPDGLAMSSRNVRLGHDDRERARALSAALCAIEGAARDGERSVAEIERIGRDTMEGMG
jgi:pantoate--beta-alanine ligase